MTMKTLDPTHSKQTTFGNEGGGHIPWQGIEEETADDGHETARDIAKRRGQTQTTNSKPHTGNEIWSALGTPQSTNHKSQITNHKSRFQNLSNFPDPAQDPQP